MVGFGQHALAQITNFGYSVEFKDMETKIISMTWAIFAGFSVVCFIIAGFMFLTAQGEPEKLKAARSAVIWGFIGIIVGIIAYSIIGIVSNSLMFEAPGG